MPKKFYITTTIPYINAAPHVGHALEYVQADVLARHHRQLSEDVLFLAGADENSLKNVRAAEKEGIKAEKLVERNAGYFKDLGKILNISFDDFIRTSVEKRHIKGAEKFWLACQKDIYKKNYKGLYCVGCEAFFKESELENGLCPDHKKKPELIEEENYFLKLSKYQRRLESLIESDEIEIIPKNRKNEVLSFIKSGLEDFSISRSQERARGWGIPVPGDKSQIMYVWFDALANYVTALDYYQEKSDKLKKYWPADVHILGKGVVRFHAVYWPAMLLSAGLTLPKKLFVHPYLTVNGEKISKSLGNVIDPKDITDKYGIDPVRYYLLREFSTENDGDFSQERLQERYTSDLANGLGNLVSRVLNISEKNNFVLKKEHCQNQELTDKLQKTEEEYKKCLEGFRFNDCLERIWSLFSYCDEFIEKNKPWLLIKEDKEKTEEVITDLLSVLKKASFLLEPFMPDTAQKISEQIRQNKKGEALFPRLS